MVDLDKIKICICVSTYNKEITFEALNVATKTLKEKGITNVHAIEVPGAFEIPVSISRHVKDYNGFIAIGCVIKGETNNFDLITKAITEALMKLSIKNCKPIGNALITTFDKEQAKKRVQKGKEAAVAVIDILLNKAKNV